jgi:hypothetical protein
MAAFDGMVWFRRRFTLTAAEAARGATLELGAIDDQDRTFVNGHAVGGSAAWDAPRVYRLAPALLRAGENEIIVNVYDFGAGGGFSGPAELVRLLVDGQPPRPLGDAWDYSVAESNPGAPPSTPWDYPTGFTWLYNGMIAPLGPIGLAGVAWYQGEADVGRDGSYADRLAAAVPFARLAIPDHQPRQFRGAADRAHRKRLGGAARPAAAGGAPRRTFGPGDRDGSRRARRYPSRQQARGRPPPCARGAALGLWRRGTGGT